MNITPFCRGDVISKQAGGEKVDGQFCGCRRQTAHSSTAALSSAITDILSNKVCRFYLNIFVCKGCLLLFVFCTIIAVTFFTIIAHDTYCHVWSQYYKADTLWVFLLVMVFNTCGLFSCVAGAVVYFTTQVSCACQIICVHLRKGWGNVGGLLFALRSLECAIYV
jgi:hypothetical protein